MSAYSTNEMMTVAAALVVLPASQAGLAVVSCSRSPNEELTTVRFPHLLCAPGAQV